MNIQAKSNSPRSINWKQIAIIAVVLGIAGFRYFNSERDAGPRDGGGTAQLDWPDQIDLNSELSRNGQASKTDLKFKPMLGSSSGAKKSSGGPYLTKQGSKKVSPAGLVYASSRIEHLMRHAHDMPNRSDSKSHGVFDADSEEDVFRLIDEAYRKIQSNSRDVSKDRDRSRDQPNSNFKKAAYTIKMNRRIGYLGGKKGNREGKPALSKIKLVLGNDVEVITAYPY